MKGLVFLLASALFLTVAPVVGFSQDLDVDANTVLLFRFDEINGDTVKDYSGNDNNGKINGNIRIAEGKWNKGYKFDGKSHILVEKSDTLDITQNLTFEVWVKCEEAGGEQFILDKRGGNPRLGYELIVTGEFMSVLMHTPALKVVLRTEPEPVSFDEWQYYAATYDGEKIKYYMNSELAKEEDLSDALGIDSDLFIGAEDGSAAFFKGVLDNLRISNVARTEDEIRKAAAVEFSGKLAATWGRMKTRSYKRRFLR